MIDPPGLQPSYETVSRIYSSLNLFQNKISTSNWIIYRFTAENIGSQINGLRQIHRIVIIN